MAGTERPDDEETPAQRLFRLFEENGLEESLRAIVEAMCKPQQQARLEFLEYILEGQPPLTEEELEQARREWED